MRRPRESTIQIGNQKATIRDSRNADRPPVIRIYITDETAEQWERIWSLAGWKVPRKHLPAAPLVYEELLDAVDYLLDTYHARR